MGWGNGKYFDFVPSVLKRITSILPVVVGCVVVRTVVVSSVVVASGVVVCTAVVVITSVVVGVPVVVGAAVISRVVLTVELNTSVLVETEI